VTVLLLKLTITPAAIALTTLAARRYGNSVGGWLIGLPVTAAPVALFLALEHGSSFAAKVALGLVTGVTAQAAFIVAYVALCKRGAGWPLALAAGTAAFAAAGVGLGLVQPRLAVVWLCSLAALGAGLAFVPSRAFVRPVAPPRFDLPLRMVLATALVLAITALATTLGPVMSGVVTAYPVLSTLLAVLAHRAAGPQAAVAVYRGLLIGLFALMGFGCALALLLSRLSLGDAFGLALALTLLIQLGSLRVVRRTATVT